MGKLVDNVTCMYPKCTPSLKILEVEVVCEPIIPLTHNTSVNLIYQPQGVYY